MAELIDEEFQIYSELISERKELLLLLDAKQEQLCQRMQEVDGMQQYVDISDGYSYF
jgi:hypothetical protein